MWACDWHWRQGVCPAETIAGEGYELVWLKAGGAVLGDAENGWKERFIDPTFFASAARVGLTPMIPGAYWYLVPGRPTVQAALLYEVLLEASRTNGRYFMGWAVKLDVEAVGLQYADVEAFVLTWAHISGGYPLVIYTNRTLWNRTLPIEWRDAEGDRSGAVLSPFLEVAHWVPESVRTDQSRPYASRQAKAIDPEWWKLPYGDGTRKRYGWGGWRSATMMQFTDNALIAGKRQMASAYPGDKAKLRSLLVR